MPVPATILCCPIRGQYFPVTMACLQYYGMSSVLLNPLNPDDPDDMKYGMMRRIHKLWTGERDLIHIDHDMVFIWDNLRDLVECQSRCCTCMYSAFLHPITAPLGFIKFSAELQRVMDFQDVVDAMFACEGCQGEWWGLEWHLITEVCKYQDEPCTHGTVLNDHTIYGLGVAMHKPKKPEISVDLETEEGRTQMIEHFKRKWATSVASRRTS